MNRSARRRAAKLGVSNKEVLQHVERKQIKQRTEEATDRALVGLLGLPCIVLKDKFGFGKKRLERFTDALLEILDSYSKDYLTVEDVLTTLKEEAGITLRKKQ